jgi:hypothetical protein
LDSTAYIVLPPDRYMMMLERGAEPRGLRLKRDRNWFEEHLPAGNGV